MSRLTLSARLHWPALVGALVLVLAVTAVSATASGARPKPAPTRTTATRTVLISPVTDAGVLKPTWRVTLQRRHGTCLTGSEAVGDGAYRCFAGNLVLDPCWVQADGGSPSHHVVCAASPWRRVVARVAVRHLTVAHGFPDNVWGIELVGGRRCTFLQGASSTHHGQRISYGCGGRLYLYGEPDRTTPRWRIGAVIYRHGHFRGDHVVTIVEAVGAHASPAP